MYNEAQKPTIKFKISVLKASYFLIKSTIPAMSSACNDFLQMFGFKARSFGRYRVMHFLCMCEKRRELGISLSHCVNASKIRRSERAFTWDTFRQLKRLILFNFYTVTETLLKHNNKIKLRSTEPISKRNFKIQ